MSRVSEQTRSASDPARAAANHSPAGGISMPAVSALQNLLPGQQEEPLYPAPRQQKPFQLKVNRTGLPDNLKTGAESLSGFSLDDVKVHYNSDKPAQLQALAFAQGTDIHVGPGHEKHLAHEAWHVVQQKQGRVQATTQLKSQVAVNDDKELEAEASIMGAKAMDLVQPQRNDSLELKSIDGQEPVLQPYWNTAFLDNIQYNAERGPDYSDMNSLDFAEHSREHAESAAFIVNAILSYKQVDEIRDVIRAIVSGLDEDDFDNIAIVLGVNGPEAEEEALDAALARAEAMIADIPIAIALVKSTFSGSFPYGRMRNEVLHSKETRGMTEYFTTINRHPYVSIQDFDTGSRMTGDKQDKHVFHAIDDFMFADEDADDDDDHEGSYEDDESAAKVKAEKGGKDEAVGTDDTRDEEDFEYDERQPSLPVMIGGGYRTGDMGKLERDTLSRLTKKGQQEERKGEKTYTLEDMHEQLKGFPQSIMGDMRHRDKYARISPMLPYAPEPNMFLDATAAYTNSPLTGTPLMFGEGASEYTEMAKRVANFSAEELEVYYTQQYRQNARGRDKRAKLELLREIQTSLSIDAQNNRHPLRDQAVHMSFEELAIETDLSRLAASSIEKGATPQSHEGLSTVTDRLFNSKKDKKGAKLGDMRSGFDSSVTGGLDKMVEASLVKTGAVRRSRQPDVSGLGKDMSTALSVPFSSEGLFSGMHYGMGPTAKKQMLYQVATQQSREKALFDYISQENFKSNAFPLTGADVSLTVSQWTVADGDCGIYSLGKLRGTEMTRKGLITELRAGIKKLAARGSSAAVPLGEARTALGSISGDNKNRWLSDDELIQVGGVLGIAGIAVVQFNTMTNRWVTIQGDPTTSANIIGGVPASLGGRVNHWVVLRRAAPSVPALAGTTPGFSSGRSFGLSSGLSLGPH